MPSFDCCEYLDVLLPFIMPENVEFFISLFSLAFTTTLDSHCQSDWHLPYIMAPRIKHNAFTVICLLSLEFHLILNGDLIITLLSSLSQCLEEYLSKLKGRQNMFHYLMTHFLLILLCNKIINFLLRFVIKTRSTDIEHLLLQGIVGNIEKYKIYC